MCYNNSGYLVVKLNKFQLSELPRTLKTKSLLFVRIRALGPIRLRNLISVGFKLEVVVILIG